MTSHLNPLNPPWKAEGAKFLKSGGEEPFLVGFPFGGFVSFIEPALVLHLTDNLQCLGQTPVWLYINFAVLPKVFVT